MVMEDVWRYESGGEHKNSDLAEHKEWKSVESFVVLSVVVDIFQNIGGAEAERVMPRRSVVASSLIASCSMLPIRDRSTRVQTIGISHD